MPALSSYPNGPTLRRLGATEGLRAFPIHDLSPFVTNQGDKLTCAYHSFSKLIIKNMISVVIDLHMTKEEQDAMMECITEHPIDTSAEIGNYSEKTCGKKGYWKIILFYYFFQYLVRNEIREVDEKVMSLATTMQTRASARLPIGHEDGTFDTMRRKITTRIEAQGIRWESISFQYNKDYKPEIIGWLKQLLSLGLSSVLLLENPRAIHSVFISEYDRDTFHIENSWGSIPEIVSEKDFPTISLLGEKWNCKTITFLCPILPEFEGLPMFRTGFKSIDWLTRFMGNYPDLYAEWKSRHQPEPITGGKRTRRRRSKHYTRFVRLRQ